MRRLITAVFIGLALLAPSPIQVEYVDCGACGAHVAEWGYVRNAENTGFVAVCLDCYHLI